MGQETTGNAHGSVLEAREIVAGYRGRAILSGISLAVPRGEIVAVLGPNGAGKSTLVRVLSGTLAPLSGSVLLNGQDMRALTRGDVARKLAVVPQEGDVAFGFTVHEVTMMGRAPHQSGLMFPSAEDRMIVERALATCDLTELSARPVSELSGGERRRVVIARALAQAPDVLLLDEPAAYLDVRHAVALYELWRRQASEQGIACVAIMHDLNAVARWADRVVLLKNGQIRANGRVDETMVPELLAEVFDVPLRVGIDPADGARYFLPGRAPRSLP
jgi:iron complex transport system ATP-binding protein